MTALLALEALTLVVSAIITFNTLGNLRAFRLLSEFARDDDDGPFVSVLIPARNEERSLGACLESLVRQDYPRYEIVVLDDNSDDDTGQIARRAAASAECVRVVSGESLPAGWLGKAFACHQLSLLARGDILLFTDADTVHDPGMVRAVVGAAREGADLVTAFPRQVIGSWSEALTVPFMLFTVWVFLPVGRVWSDPSPRAVAANGQLLAFTRNAYEGVGGHAAVRASALDDIDLARRAKAAGLRVRLADGVGTVRTRMYTNAAEVWRGFSKNALPLLGGSLAIAIAISVVMTLLYLVPPIVLIGGVVTGRGGWTWRALPAVLVSLMLAQAVIVSIRTRAPVWQAILHPLRVVSFLAILANSIRWRWRGHGEWKGRTYATRPDARGGATTPRMRARK